MTDLRPPQSRRSFLSKLAAGALASGATPLVLSATERRNAYTMATRAYQSANDRINLAVIGAGGMRRICKEKKMRTSEGKPDV